MNPEFLTEIESSWTDDKEYKKDFFTEDRIVIGEYDKISGDVLEEIYKSLNKLSIFSGRTVFIKKMSSEAVNDIPDNLDFVCIDGNHTYDFVKQDTEFWSTKIKKEELLVGMTYIIKMFSVLL